MQVVKTIKATINPKRAIKATINPKCDVKAKVSIPHIMAMEPYTGDYDVIPIFTDITLETRGKSMTDDVTVTSIPVKKVTNFTGGYTVTIGGDM